MVAAFNAVFLTPNFKRAGNSFYGFAGYFMVFYCANELVKLINE